MLRRLFWCCLGLGACTGVTDDQGLDAWLRVQGAEYREGALTAGEGRARVESLQLANNDVRPGSVGKKIQGSLSLDSSGLLLGLAGDRGYWVLPAGLPQPDVPDLPGFDARLDFTRDLAGPKQTLLVVPVAANGRRGRAETRELRVLSEVPDGELVVSLTWDSDADLDLHVTDPEGIEIYKRNPTSYEVVPGEPPDPNGLDEAGVLDVDSNASCVADGRRRENVLWNTSPPLGSYVIRVDTFSMCAASYAYWQVEVWLRGVSVLRSAGESLPGDTAFPHDRGAGVLAGEFDVAD